MSLNFSVSLVFSFLFIFSSLSHASRHGYARHHHRRISIGQSSAAQSGGVVAVELWCVAKNNAEDSALQSALDWACGQGGSDCGPIQQGGPCYDPSDIRKTASFAFNDYFLKHGLSEDSCNFASTAALTSLNPSHANCKFPSSFTVNNGSSIGSATSAGLGPSIADTSDGNHIAAIQAWALLVINLLCAIKLIL